MENQVNQFFQDAENQDSPLRLLTEFLKSEKQKEVDPITHI